MKEIRILKLNIEGKTKKEINNQVELMKSFCNVEAVEIKPHEKKRRI